jgi:putative oxidoreductase
MNTLSRPQTIVSWLLQLTVAGILLQTLFFKFTGAEESVYIFSTAGQFVHVPALEPWGRIGSGVVELIASLLLLVPATASLGAVVTMGVLGGAILSHLLILGIEVKADSGLLFGLAVIAFVGAAIVLVIRRAQVPAVGRYFQASSSKELLTQHSTQNPPSPQNKISAVSSVLRVLRALR